MKIAIHHREGSFSDGWIEYCDKKNITYKVVNCYDTDIIQQLKGCDALMWHHNHTTYMDVLAAKNILFSLEHVGIKVFPNFKSNWHFDDKMAEMYLLQAIGAPLVPSYLFYDKKTALTWIEKTNFPKVFKLKGGSGSRNVKLAKNKKEAIKLVKKSFGNGFSQFDRLGHLKERYRKYKLGKDTISGLLKGVYRIFAPTLFARMAGREKGYAYFQDFLPNNKFDIRLIVIGDKAYGMKRGVREGDFRASGSGDFIYNSIDSEVIEIAFEVSRKLSFQAMAYDFIYDEENKPLIVEISYGFGTKGSSMCPGYWDRDLNWHEGKFNPQAWMVEDLIYSTD